MNKTGRNYQAASFGDIQTRGRVTLHHEARSLVQFTEGDGVILETKPTWLQKAGA